MGRGRSGLGGGGGGGNVRPSTPAGIDYQQFMAMSEQERFQTIDDIITNPNIQVPAYLDGSDTSKVMYALGMNNKPTVVSDDQFDKLPGKDLYRTVYDSPNPPPYSADILDQIRTGDYTQLSGSGGSAHGRALYFARDDFSESAYYGMRGSNAKVMRAKINPNAKIVSERTLRSQMAAKGFSSKTRSAADDYALYALSQGIDGWHSGNYTMMVNRGVLTASSKNKSIRPADKKSVRAVATSWATADDA